MRRGNFPRQILQQDFGGKTGVFFMRRLKSADQLSAGIKRQRAFVAEILNFTQRLKSRRAADRMFRRMSLKPCLFEGNQIELIRAGEQSIKLGLIDQIAKAPLRRRPFNQLFIPRLRQIAQLLRRDVANVNLMRRISRRRGKVAQQSRQICRPAPDCRATRATASSQSAPSPAHGPMNMKRLRYRRGLDLNLLDSRSPPHAFRLVLSAKGLVFQEHLGIAGREEN